MLASPWLGNGNSFVQHTWSHAVGTAASRFMQVLPGLQQVYEKGRRWLTLARLAMCGRWRCWWRMGGGMRRGVSVATERWETASPRVRRPWDNLEGALENRPQPALLHRVASNALEVSSQANSFIKE